MCNHSLPRVFWVILVQKVPQRPHHTGNRVSVLAASTEMLDVLMASQGMGGTSRKGLTCTSGLLSTSGCNKALQLACPLQSSKPGQCTTWPKETGVEVGVLQNEPIPLNLHRVHLLKNHLSPRSLDN